MSPELMLVLRILLFSVVVVGLEVLASRREARREPESKYRDFKPALDKTYGGRHARHR